MAIPHRPQCPNAQREDFTLRRDAGGPEAPSPPPRSPFGISVAACDRVGALATGGAAARAGVGRGWGDSGRTYGLSTLLTLPPAFADEVENVIK